MTAVSLLVSLLTTCITVYASLYTAVDLRYAYNNLSVAIATYFSLNSNNILT